MYNRNVPKIALLNNHAKGNALDSEIKSINNQFECQIITIKFKLCVN